MIASQDSTSLCARVRLGALSLGGGGILFALYQVVRPVVDTAETMASGAWVVSHVLAMLGFVLISLGLVGLQVAVSRTVAEPIAARSVVATWMGTGLTLPYYGAETFGIQVIAEHSRTTGDPSLLELVEAFRLGAVPITTFALGLGLLGVGAILAALATRRSGILPPSSAIVFVVGFVLLLPQFFAPQYVRMVHGVIVAVGCLQVAQALRSTVNNLH